MYTNGMDHSETKWRGGEHRRGKMEWREPGRLRGGGRWLRMKEAEQKSIPSNRMERSHRLPPSVHTGTIWGAFKPYSALSTHSDPISLGWDPRTIISHSFPCDPNLQPRVRTTL